MFRRVPWRAVTWSVEPGRRGKGVAKTLKQIGNSYGVIID
jgi:hypothetical protein